MKTMNRLIVVVVAAIVLVASSTRPMAGALLEPGQPAPALTVSGPDGQPVTLASLTGHPVLVDFWASWCPPCRVSIPAFDGLYRELHARGFEMLAINVDERRQDADAFLAGHQYVMPLFFDPAGHSPLAAGVEAMPTSFLVDRAGTIRFVHRGYASKDLPAYRREILQLLAE